MPPERMFLAAGSRHIVSMTAGLTGPALDFPVCYHPKE
jgi:hypothetical protein